VKHMTGRIFKANARMMIEKYDADPRNIFAGVTLNTAWERLQEFKYWGAGLASLYLGEMLDLGIVNPTNTHEYQPKIDIHKSRVPANINAIILNPGIRYLYFSELSTNLGLAYAKSAQRTGVNMVRVDAGIWAIGTNVCAKDDYNQCMQYCPLVDYCQGNAKQGRLKATPNASREFRSAGHLCIYHPDGSRVDKRKNRGQQDLLPGIHNLPPKPTFTPPNNLPNGPNGVEYANSINHNEHQTLPQETQLSLFKI